MRQEFIQDLSIGVTPISKVKIPNITRDELPPVLIALQYIFITPELNKAVFSILNKAISNRSKRIGGNGMTLWEMLVLAVIRNTLNTNYDRLHDLANHHGLLQKIMGVYRGYGYEENECCSYGLQTIKDNVSLIDESLIEQINELVVQAGHQLVKKEDEKLEINIDTYAMESNVHFPTDLNLLWDSIRKSVLLLRYFSKNYNLKGCRKYKYWLRELKKSFRVSSRVHQRGGKNKELRLKEIVSSYLNLAISLSEKVADSIEYLSNTQTENTEISYFIKLTELEYFYQMLIKHIDLVNRRIMLDETIPASEKLVSIFETHTEWLNKGKSGSKSIELGHNVLIATDQYQYIVHYQVVEKTADAHLTLKTTESLYQKYNGRIKSLSFDKGFYSKVAKEHIISGQVSDILILPKKGKLNSEEKQEESTIEFKGLRNKHSRVEGNINRLEYNGLDKCPDKGLKGFKRYVSLGILSYNLHNLGRFLIKEAIKESRKNEPVLKRA